MKIMGKREIGQLSLFDLLILLSIADITVIGIENYDQSIFYWITPVFFLAIVQKSIAFFSLKFPWLRHLFDGKEVLVVNDGEIIIKNLKSQNYNLDDFLMLMRQEQLRTIDEIEFAVLETNGSISFFPYSDTKNFPIPLITSGKINKDHLKFQNVTIERLENELQKRKLQLKEVLLCYEKDKSLKFIKELPKS